MERKVGHTIHDILESSHSLDTRELKYAMSKKVDQRHLCTHMYVDYRHVFRSEFTRA